MDERDGGIDRLFEELNKDIEELGKIEQELYEAAIKAATEPW